MKAIPVAVSCAALSSSNVPWPSFSNVLSLRQPHPQVGTTLAARHHCSFWGVR